MESNIPVHLLPPPPPPHDQSSVHMAPVIAMTARSLNSLAAPPNEREIMRCGIAQDPECKMGRGAWVERGLGGGAGREVLGKGGSLATVPHVLTRGVKSQQQWNTCINPLLTTSPYPFPFPSPSLYLSLLYSYSYSHSHSNTLSSHLL